MRVWNLLPSRRAWASRSMAAGWSPEGLNWLFSL